MTLVNAFVISRVDYCNGVLALCPKTVLDKLQSVLNAAARTVLQLDRSVHVLRRLVRDTLHWLRVPERVAYKLCTLTWKALHGLGPSYLADVCKSVQSCEIRSHLRSASEWKLLVPRHKLSTYGPRAFAHAGPATWNSLPARLRNPESSDPDFCSGLKTYLFGLSYG